MRRSRKIKDNSRIMRIIRDYPSRCDTFTCAKLPFPSFPPASYLKTILHYVQSFTHKSYRSASSVTISVSITVDRNGGFFHIHARTIRIFFLAFPLTDKIPRFGIYVYSLPLFFFRYKAVNVKRSLTMLRANIYRESMCIIHWEINKI